MGVVLFLTVVTVVCLYFVINADVFSEASFCGIFGLALGFIGWLVVIPVLMSRTQDTKKMLADYNQDKIKIEVASTTDNISPQERKDAIDLAMKDNSIINDHRIWIDNFWVGWFFYKEVGELPLIDITKIKSSDQKQTITLDKMN